MTNGYPEAFSRIAVRRACPSRVELPKKSEKKRGPCDYCRQSIAASYVHLPPDGWQNRIDRRPTTRHANVDAPIDCRNPDGVIARITRQRKRPPLGFNSERADRRVEPAASDIRHHDFPLPTSSAHLPPTAR